MAYVSQEVQEDSERHLFILMTIMDSLEECLSVIPNKNYKVIMENLGVLHSNFSPLRQTPTFQQIRDDIFENDPITIQVARRATLPVMTPNEKLISDDEKIKMGYVRCIRCDSVVKHLRAHQDRLICNTIRKTKRLTYTTNQVNTADQQTLINKLKRELLKETLP